jgi:KUP system potassium uptake protein
LSDDTAPSDPCAASHPPPQPATVLPVQLTMSGEWRAKHAASPEEKVLPLALAALGIVYGDIGTSPLYAMRECFHGIHGTTPTPEKVIGVLSLIFWSLLVIVTIKYVGVIMRADNEGEGGILALMALVNEQRNEGPPQGISPRIPLSVVLGLFGAALLYGDGMITPAISVLSAVEGLEVATPQLEAYVVPITLAILIGLFMIQRSGTARVGALFGPITLAWFVTLAILGFVSLVQKPAALKALHPAYGVGFLIHEGWHGFRVLGGVFLVVTGGEALYADMGHFGKRPIRLAWLGVVLPALTIHYFGQGALLLRDPEAAVNPFYKMVPGFLLYPMVLLSTAATVIASQAMITGAFSITRQAIQLGYLPRVDIRHTSAEEIGQIYIPTVNWALLIATISLVLGFRTSSALAAAYGIAVSLTMVITVILGFVVFRTKFRWSIPGALLIAGFFFAIDIAFLGANLLKIADGGWFPLVMGAAIFTLLTTWRRGRSILAERLKETLRPLDEFLDGIDRNPPCKVPGTAVYLTSSPQGVPPGLAKNIDHNKVLHEQIVLLRIEAHRVPYVERDRCVTIERIRDGIYRMTAHIGFMEHPSVPILIQAARAQGLDIDLATATFVLGRETILPTDRPGMALWREHLFAFMSRNAQRAAAFFRIPSERVLEIGTQIEM